jgi:orotate phosphoribosyltransferase
MDIPALIRTCAKLSGTFTLRSGKVSDTYFDKYRFEAEPQLLRDICQAMAALIPTGTEVLAGLEMGGIPIVTVLSQVTGLPSAFIRKEPKAYGTCQYAEGTPLQGKKFVLVEDVVSSGGAIILCALCVIDRETGGKEALEKAGLQLRALHTFAEINKE